MMFDYDRVKKECFWDIKISKEEILSAIKGKNKREKQFVFEKILLNSTKMFMDLKYFAKDELEDLLSNFEIPKFNNKYILRRKNLAEVYFFDKELLIDELKWVA